jgi:hypothetical protein
MYIQGMLVKRNAEGSRDSHKRGRFSAAAFPHHPRLTLHDASYKTASALLLCPNVINLSQAIRHLHKHTEDSLLNGRLNPTLFFSTDTCPYAHRIRITMWTA